MIGVVVAARNIRWVTWDDGGVWWMAHVRVLSRLSSCAGADLSQLARPFRLVLGHDELRSLRHQYGTYIHRIRHHLPRFRGSIRIRCV